MQDILTPLRHTVPTLIAALAILIIGYLVALIVGAVVRGVARRSGLDRRLAPLVVGPERAGQVDAAPAVGRLAFWLVMLFVLVAFFQALNLTLVTRPLDSLLTLVFAYIPLLIGAGVLLLVAWIIATILRTLLLRFLPALRLDERLSGGAGVAPPFASGIEMCREARLAS